MRRMKLTVFGATGGTGSQVVRQALDAGHEVVAVVRDPARLPVSHQNLTAVTADVMRADDIADAVTGRDAIISALGHSRGRPDGTAANRTLCADSAGAITAAMRMAGSRRLVIVSASGPYPDAGDGPVLRYLAKPILGRTVFKAVWSDLAAMEDVVRASGLDWTVLRPPRLTDKPLTGRYRTRQDLNLRGGLRVSRADLAHLALAVAGDQDTYRTTIYLAD
jgi:putative NADH-flavin reductase